jgi:hypothetical protein
MTKNDVLMHRNKITENPAAGACSIGIFLKAPEEPMTRRKPDET